MRRLIFAAVLVLVAGLANAQTLKVNPTIVEFQASADHNATNIDGTAIVTGYTLRIFLEGATDPFSNQSLGKPTPVAGLISVTNSALFAGLATGLRYTARVVAVGPTGEGVSALSNPFGNARTTPPVAPSVLVVK